MEELTIIGKPLPRIDAVRKVTGEAIYGGDVVLPGMLHGKVLRSPFPHARILNVDTSRAKQLPGVKAVITGKDTPGIPFGMAVADEQIIAIDKARYIGDEIAAVAAGDEDTALEALDLIQVEYEQLPAAFEPEEALKPEAALIHDDAPGNLAAHLEVDRGDVDRAFAEADYIVEETFVTPVVHQAHLEPSGCVASFDASGNLTVWLGHMRIHGVRLEMAAVLGLPESRLNIIRQDCGGAFGARITMKAIYPICALLAKEAGRPVRLFNTVEEELISTRPRAAAKLRLKAGATRDGKLIAKETGILVNTGAYCNLGPFIMMALSTRTDSLYRVPNIRTRSKSVYTNSVPPGAFRGFGNPQMTFAFETVMDMLAEKIGLDPVEFKLKNLSRVGDITAHGWKLRSCGLSECLERVADQAGWKAKKARTEQNQKTGANRRRGVGVACMIHPSDMRYWENFMGSTAFVRILEDGKVAITTGEAEFGQGADTVHAQIAAEVLGLPLDHVTVLPSDTLTSPFAVGPFASRTTISGGMAAKLAAEDAREQLKKVAAELLEARPEDLDLKDGRLFVRGSEDRSVSFAEVAQSALYRRGGSAIIGKGVDERNTDYVYVSPDPNSADPRRWQVKVGNPSSGYIFSAQVAEVEVDIQTGQVEVVELVEADDLGRTINQMAAEGQAQGGIVQGLGFGLMEEYVYDNQGSTMNPSFLGYLVPTAPDRPKMRVSFVESIEPNGPFGAKGLGESAINCTAAAVANAIYNAAGVRVLDLPATPEKLVKGLKEL